MPLDGLTPLGVLALLGVLETLPSDAELEAAPELVSLGMLSVA
jgi:hypothetical protein